jgi:hypothetical protein
MVTEAQRDQQDRIDVQRNDADVRRQQQQGSTYLDHTHSDLGGRFAITEHQTVVGRPSPAPPPLPPTSPWAGPDPTGPEPPLGYAIDALESSATVSSSAPKVEAQGAPVSEAPSSGLVDDDVEPGTGAPRPMATK